MENLEQTLKKIYYDPSNPGSFGGAEALHREARKIFENLAFKDVKDWLSGELVYTLHKPLRKKFKRNPMVAEKPHENMQADLVDMKLFSKYNDGYNYILTAIDIFSKKGFAIPLKNKNQEHVKNAMEKIIIEYPIHKLMTDKGKEFENNTFKKLMSDYKTHHYFSKNSEIKCAVVERFNKTLKNRMFRYFTLKGKRRFLEILPEILKSYNSSYHRSIKMSPNQVNEENSSQVFKNLYGFDNKRELLFNKKKPSIPTDVSVRRKYDLKIMDRGYYPNWTDEIYKIYKSVPGENKPYYHLKDEQGNIVQKRFYPTEVQVVKPSLFRVEKVLKERKYRGDKQVYVKWLNYPASYNSWINAKDLTNINDG